MKQNSESTVTKYMDPWLLLNDKQQESSDELHYFFLETRRASFRI